VKGPNAGLQPVAKDTGQRRATVTQTNARGKLLLRFFIFLATFSRHFTVLLPHPIDFHGLTLEQLLSQKDIYVP
jgi:hypothetical protein